MKIFFYFSEGEKNENGMFPGKPTSQITWLSKGELLQNRSQIAAEPNIVTSKLEIRNLTRSQDNNFYTCTANNSQLISPQQRSVQVKLNCKFNRSIY